MNTLIQKEIIYWWSRAQAIEGAGGMDAVEAWCDVGKVLHGLRAGAVAFDHGQLANDLELLVNVAFVRAYSFAN